MTKVAAPEIRTIRGQLGLSQELFSRVLDVSARSVGRWEARGVTRMHAETMLRLVVAREILSLAVEVYGSQIATFMATPRRSLSMRTPREAMIRGDLESVRRLLISTLEGHWA
jgi:transcriptional regulator with XRE-family HTH domain